MILKKHPLFCQISSFARGIRLVHYAFLLHLLKVYYP